MTIVDELIALYDGPSAARFYDEAVTELQHALQCAALAVRAGASDALTAAALLHDVGHLVLDDNVALTDELTVDRRHESVGARFLAPYFPPSVTAPIALHVAAKRYLCTSEPGYFASLSPSSVRSLALQGGPMDEHEAVGIRTATRVRRCRRSAAMGRLGQGRADSTSGEFGRHVPMLRLLVTR